MTMKTLTALLALGIWALPQSVAEARQYNACGKREAIVAQLAETYGESRQSIGLGTDNTLVEVYASNETGTWTITATFANGMTCLVATGESFESLAEALPEVSEQDA